MNIQINCKDNVDKNYVHKDKIREKLKWLDEEGYWEFNTDRDLTLCCEILRELLEDK